MIVTDLDGTLLRDDKTVSEYTVSVLKRCREIGTKTVFATGRGGSAEWIAPGELFDAKITMNGSRARIGDEVVYNKLAPWKSAQKVLLACDARGMKTASQLYGTDYSNFNVTEEWPWITNFIEVHFENHELDAEKIYAVPRNQEDVDAIRESLPDDLYLVVSNDGLAMVMHRDATKSKAAAALAERWGISQKEIAAFGDDLNDIDLLEYAGIGVAMANALPEVLSVADEICGSNEDDGMAKWIEENILQ